MRLRNVGDTRPAASLFHAVEHQALVGLMAERAGVSAPGVDRIVRAGDTALLVMPWVDGCSLDRLQKCGVEPSAGVAGVGVNALAGAIVHAVLLVIFFSWAGRGLGRAFKLPSSSKLLVILAVLAAVVGLVLITRQGRRFAARKLLPSLKSSLASLGRVARSPVRLTLLFGGSALVTLSYIGGLVVSVAAFGASASIAQVGAVYLVASLIAAASPTPGGLGAIEAATIAGLTGIGISSGPAVSAVLVYRLATYWLPVLPGWYSWRLLQRMDYL